MVLNTAKYRMIDDSKNQFNNTFQSLNL